MSAPGSGAARTIGLSPSHRPASLPDMSQPDPSEADLANARRARRLLFVLMAGLIVLPWLVWLLRG